MNVTEHKPTTRVLDILQLLSHSLDGFSLTEIANLIKVPKSTITPIIKTLYGRHFITINEATGKYVVGLNSFIIGSAYLRDMDILSLIQPEMKKIVTKTSETCQLGMLIDSEVLYLAKEDSPFPIRLISFVGKRLPAYCTAIGKALLSDYSKEKIAFLYPKELIPITPKTVTNIDILCNQLAAIRKTKVAIEREEASENLNCFATPLKYNGKIIAAISVSIPTFRLNKEKEQVIIDQLLLSKKDLENIFVNLKIDEIELSGI